MSRLRNAFGVVSRREETALIGFVMGGDPTPKYGQRIAEALIRGGVDILELGIPFSDPIADGPTIQAAAVRSLASGTTSNTVIDLAKTLGRHYDIPIVLLTYYNLIRARGIQNFMEKASGSNVDGIVIPDLPAEEAEEYKETAVAYGLDTIFLAAPTTSVNRLSRILELTSGFLYLVSLTGVTGARSEIQIRTLELVKRFVKLTKGKVPLGVGFGISKPDHVRQLVKAGVDAAIVGSSFVDIIAKNLEDIEDACTNLEVETRRLKEATRNS
mgnify:CR=1 FL=1